MNKRDIVGLARQGCINDIRSRVKKILGKVNSMQTEGSVQSINDLDEVLCHIEPLKEELQRQLSELMKEETLDYECANCGGFRKDKSNMDFCLVVNNPDSYYGKKKASFCKLECLAQFSRQAFRDHNQI